MGFVLFVGRARRRGRGAWGFGARALALVGLAACAARAVGACALGEEEEPGCQTDEACGSGYLCRAGACFRVTTGLTPPVDPDAGGDSGD